MGKNETEATLKRLEKQLANYQKKYNELAKQSPTRWWHDEYFDN